MTYPIKESEESEPYDKVLDAFFFKEFKFENEGYRYYYDHWCDQYKDSLNKYDRYGIACDCKYVFLAEPKDGSQPMYVAFDTQGRPFLEWKDSWDFEFKDIIHRNAIREQNNIIYMAEKVKRKKKVKK